MVKMVGGRQDHTAEELFAGEGPSYLKQKTPHRARYEDPPEPPRFPIKPTQNGSTTAAREF